MTLFSKSFILGTLPFEFVVNLIKKITSLITPLFNVHFYITEGVT